jgi:hypothetical protein
MGRQLHRCSCKCCRPIAKSNQPRERISVFAIVLLCLAGVHVVSNGSAIKSKERIKYENAVLNINNLFRNPGGPRR